MKSHQQPIIPSQVPVNKVCSAHQFKWMHLSNPAVTTNKHHDQSLKHTHFKTTTAKTSHYRTIWCTMYPHFRTICHKIHHYRTIHCTTYPIFRTICHKTCHYRAICHTMYPSTRPSHYCWHPWHNSHQESILQVSWTWRKHACCLYYMHWPLHIPIQHERFKVPIEYKEQMDKTLQNMKDLKIITPVTQPTEWVSLLTYPHKDMSLHTCLDSRDLNKAKVWEHYKAPTLQEISHKFQEQPSFPSNMPKMDFGVFI